MMKLKSLTCSVIKFKDDKKNVYTDSNVKIDDSPWIPYLKNKNTDKLYESFRATQNHPDHPNDYWYDVEKFDKLVESIQNNGYKNDYCNNPLFQNNFNNKWRGGKGKINISNKGEIGDGHHRCAILYHLYGPDFEIEVNNGIMSNLYRPNLYNKGILIVWPSHIDFKDTIIKELNINNYKIIDEKDMNVSIKYIKNILREIHYPKKWWEENLETEYIKRINKNSDVQKLKYFIVEKEDIHLQFKSFKKMIREKHNIDKSYFHLCDPDCLKHLGMNCDCPCDKNNFINETKKHIDMLTNKNTIHFLNNSEYKKELNFYKYFEEYRYTLLNNNIESDLFCIDNGGILASYGIRDTHDLDFLNLYSDNISLNEHFIGCENKNHRLEYEKLGYSISDIINNPDNYFYHFGMKFMSLEILKKFKYNRTHTIGTGHKEIRQKDINDYKLIKYHNMIKVFYTCSWDSDPVHFLNDKYKPLTPNNSGEWKNIVAVTDINDADWLIIVDDINPQQINDIMRFNSDKVICIPREPAKKNPYYSRLSFKYKYTYQNFFHCWTSIMCIQKNYDELLEYNKPILKNKVCSTITSRFNPGGGIYGERIEFIKKLSQQKQFLNKIDIFGYNWTEKELGKMYKGTFGGFNVGTSDKIDKLLPNTTKWDGLEKYSYSIAIENSCLENYFSEKFTDCILSWTIPIYYGCPNIDKYFSKDCYYWLDINSPNCFEELDKILNTPITEKQIKAIEKARDVILNKHNIWNVVNDVVKNH